jgi:hypothetical protein
VAEDQRYHGYFDQDNIAKRVAMKIRTDGYKEYGEYYFDNKNGCEKVERPDGVTLWG